MKTIFGHTLKAPYLLILLGLLAACGGDLPGSTAATESAAPIRVSRFGPSRVTAGRPFNTQPNGMCALWFLTEGATPTTIVLLDGQELTTQVRPTGKVTAAVPADQLALPGTHSLQLVDPESGATSEPLELIVEVPTGDPAQSKPALGSLPAFPPKSSSEQRTEHRLGDVAFPHQP